MDEFKTERVRLLLQKRGENYIQSFKTSHRPTLYGGVIITGEGLQIFIFTRHLWPLSSEFFSVRKP